MQILVGSKALAYHGYNVTPKDIDVWSDEPAPCKQEGVDWCVLPTEILHLVEVQDGYASMDSLYTIKCSHLGWSNLFWNKHKLDALMLKRLGCKLIEPLYQALLEFWKTELSDKSFLSLSKNKDDFFTDDIKYVYDHDYLHELVAYPNLPVYTTVLKDGEDVLIDKNKFDLLSHSDKIRMFREEITVIALERWLIPTTKHNYEWTEAYNNALEKTVTTLTKGWATDFIVRNLEEFVLPDFSYFKKPMEVLNMGIVTNAYDLEVFEELYEKFGVENKAEFLFGLFRGNGYSDSMTDGTDEDNQCPRTLKAALENDYGYEVVGDGYHGDEGGGEHCYEVIKLKDKYYKATWRYYSYNGCEYDWIEETIKEVKPEVKTVTVFK